MAVLSSVATENLRTKSGKVLRRRLNAEIKRGDLILSGPQRTALNLVDRFLERSYWHRRWGKASQSLSD